jgi:hypothetical protein
MTGAAPTVLKSNAWLPAAASVMLSAAIKRGKVMAYLDVKPPPDACPAA